MPIADATHFLNQRLLAAIDRDDLEGCRSFLDHGADPNADGRANGTVLTNAIARGFSAGVMLLLDRGAKVDAVDSFRQAPLVVAANKGDISTCRALIKRGAAVSAIDNSGDTPMHGAARQGHTEICSMLLSHGASVNGLNGRCRTPLHIAAFGAEPFAIDTCRWLVDRGADAHFVPPAPRDSYLTPMQLAATDGLPIVVEFFLSRFPDGINSRTLSGKALDEIASAVNAEIVRAAMTARSVDLELGDHQLSSTTPLRSKSFGPL
jgi:ankyrin repeat protein